MLESLQERIDELEAKLKGQTPKEQVATLRRRLSVEGARIQELLSEASEDSSENMAAAQNIQAAFDKDTPITPEKKGQMGQIYSELETVYASPEKKESAAEAGRRAGYMGAEFGKKGAEFGSLDKEGFHEQMINPCGERCAEVEAEKDNVQTEALEKGDNTC